MGAEQMNFPKYIHEFLESYSFIDKQEVYTNGAKLIPLFRVEQALKHYSQPKVSEWISVEEELPKEKGEYLVTYHPCYRDDIATQFCYVGIDNFRGKTSWTKSKYQKVIAWQPLPEPFKRGKDR